MDCIVHRVAKSRTRLSDSLSLHRLGKSRVRSLLAVLVSGYYSEQHGTIEFESG